MRSVSSFFGSALSTRVVVSIQSHLLVCVEIVTFCHAMFDKCQVGMADCQNPKSPRNNTHKVMNRNTEIEEIQINESVRFF